jgi:hypothetical protein
MNYIPPHRITTNDSAQPNRLFYEDYSVEEQAVLRQLVTLFKEWHAAFKRLADESGQIVGVGGASYRPDGVSFDGFFPGYLNQRKRVLFIGKESRTLCGSNYIEEIYEAYKVNRIGKLTLNQYAFHRRMFKIAYSIQHRETSFEKIPPASELIDSFGTEKLSYALMNISKFSNGAVKDMGR